MGRSRVKKSAYQSWNPSILKQAIEAVKDRGMALRKASKIYGIPKTTLKRRIDEVDKPETDESKLYCNKRTVFTPEQEHDLKQLLLTMAETCHSFTSKDVRYMAFQFAEKNGINHRFNRERGLAGVDWFYGFKERHPEIPLKNSESLTAPQSHCFSDKLSVVKFAESLRLVLEQNKLIPHRIYNAEQYCVTATEILSATSVVHNSDDVLFRAVLCMSAGGTFIPPFLSLDCAAVDPKIEDQMAPGTMITCCDKGWTASATLMTWFKHFLRYTKPSEDDPVLLLVKEEPSFSSGFVTSARESHVTILFIPGQKRQPLDISFSAPLNKIYSLELEHLHNSNPEKLLDLIQISDTFAESYLQASIPKTAIQGFRVPGIFPYN